MLVKLGNSTAPAFVSVWTPLGKVGTAHFNAPTVKFVLNDRLSHSSPKLQVTVNGTLHKQCSPSILNKPGTTQELKLHSSNL